jgi:preprotein translocase subunit SecE
VFAENKMFELFIRANWVAILLFAIAVVLAVAILRRYGHSIRNFAMEVRTELAKASWPWDPKEKGFKKYKELSDSTMIVVIAMLLLAGYISLWDFILNLIVGALT